MLGIDLSLQHPKRFHQKDDQLAHQLGKKNQNVSNLAFQKQVMKRAIKSQVFKQIR